MLGMSKAVLRSTWRNRSEGWTYEVPRSEITESAQNPEWRWHSNEQHKKWHWKTLAQNLLFIPAYFHLLKRVVNTGNRCCCGRVNNKSATLMIQLIFGTKGLINTYMHQRSGTAETERSCSRKLQLVFAPLQQSYHGRWWMGGKLRTNFVRTKNKRM